MGNNIVSASKMTFNSKDKILFDCNVLMYLFYTYGGYPSKLINDYKSILKKAIRNKCKIYIPSIEISELINTYIRAEYRRYLRSNQLNQSTFDFKHNYRKTTDYKNTINEIRSIINKQILSVFSKLDDKFSQIDISNIYDDIEQFDFNDRYYCKLAEKYSLILVTNDTDFSFSNENIKIITANKQLLASSNMT